MVSRYAELLIQMEQLKAHPIASVPIERVQRQASKGRMTVWQRLEVLTGNDFDLHWRNFGKELDGAGIVTAIGNVNGRQVGIYGHDFTQRAGAMDEQNGDKLAAFLEYIGKLGLPLIGMNDSAGALIQAGVASLQGYAKAFRALRQLSGRVPSIMLMFGYNAGGGAYLPRQGSFVIQPAQTFVGLTGPAVVQTVLGEAIEADALGGPGVHLQSGVADYTAIDERAALEQAKALLHFLPNNSSQAPPPISCSDDPERATVVIDRVLQQAIDSPTGFQTPFDVRLLIQDMVDWGHYFEVQPERAENIVCCFARMAGKVVGFCANNSAHASGQIDWDGANKATRFLRFCNVYNIGVVFLEDTTGFLPGSVQEQRGIIQAGRALLDGIVDLRVPRILLVIRNAYGGAYACFNNYATGADVVLALPTARIAVMGLAGTQFVYKQKIQALQAQYADQDPELEASLLALDQDYTDRYLNANAALQVGAVSDLVSPLAVRRVLNQQLERLYKSYRVEPMSGLQREFF